MKITWDYEDQSVEVTFLLTINGKDIVKTTNKYYDYDGIVYEVNIYAYYTGNKAIYSDPIDSLFPSIVAPPSNSVIEGICVTENEGNRLKISISVEYAGFTDGDPLSIWIYNPENSDDNYMYDSVVGNGSTINTHLIISTISWTNPDFQIVILNDNDPQQIAYVDLIQGVCASGQGFSLPHPGSVQTCIGDIDNNLYFYWGVKWYGLCEDTTNTLYWYQPTDESYSLNEISEHNITTGGCHVSTTANFTVLRNQIVVNDGTFYYDQNRKSPGDFVVYLVAFGNLTNTGYWQLYGYVINGYDSSVHPQIISPSPELPLIMDSKNTINIDVFSWEQIMYNNYLTISWQESSTGKITQIRYGSPTDFWKGDGSTANVSFVVPHNTVSLYILIIGDMFGGNIVKQLYNVKKA